MGGRFFDVTSNAWYYNDILEMDAILDTEDRPLISGIPFNSFVEGHRSIDDIITVPTPTNTIIVNSVLTHTSETPVKVYIDGITTLFDSITANSPSVGVSTIKMKRTVSPSSTIRIIQQGIPAVGSDGRPLGVNSLYAYPQIALPIDSGYSYIHDPFSSAGFEKVTYRGSQLKYRRYVDGIESDYNFFQDADEYTINKSGILLVPFELDNSVLNVDYLVKNDTTGTQSQKWVGGSTNIARRPPIQGSNPPTRYDKVYFGFFPDVSITRAEFITFLNKIRIRLYNNFSEVTPYTNPSKTSSRFTDVNNALAGGSTWWWEHVRDMEDLKMSDGTYLMQGYPDGNLHYGDKITRAQVVTFINRFREWFIDSFK